MSTTTCFRSLFSATAWIRSSKFFSVVSPSLKGTSWFAARLLTIPRRLPRKSSYVVPVALAMVKSRTGNGLSHSHGSESMASPANSSRRHSNIAFRVESMSDLPKRRGREMKSCASVLSRASSYRKPVLSTYFFSWSAIRRGNTCIPVVSILICFLFSMAVIIADSAASAGNLMDSRRPAPSAVHRRTRGNSRAA